MKKKYYPVSDKQYVSQNGLTENKWIKITFESAELAISVGQRYFNHFAVHRDTFDGLDVVESIIYANVDKGVVQIEKM